MCGLCVAGVRLPSLACPARSCCSCLVSKCQLLLHRPCPYWRFTTCCRPVVVLNKVDRPGATEQRCGEVESCELAVCHLASAAAGAAAAAAAGAAAAAAAAAAAVALPASVAPGAAAAVALPASVAPGAAAAACAARHSTLRHGPFLMQPCLTAQHCPTSLVAAVFDVFALLGASDDQLDFPVLYASAREVGAACTVCLCVFVRERGPLLCPAPCSG